MTKRTRKSPEYPPNWSEMAKACKDAAKWRCEWCGVIHGEERIGKNGKAYKVFMTVHHPDNDTLNPDARLVCLCQECHLRDDVVLHMQHARETRRLGLIEAGQLPMFEEAL